jgi:cytoskeletal protein CcmA (bactofilin family)
VDGNITAVHTLEITRSGRVHGDLTGGKIVIEEGSSYRGKVKVETGREEELVEEEKEELKVIKAMEEPAAEIQHQPQPHMFQDV